MFCLVLARAQRLVYNTRATKPFIGFLAPARPKYARSIINIFPLVSGGRPLDARWPPLAVPALASSSPPPLPPPPTTRQAQSAQPAMLVVFMACRAAGRQSARAFLSRARHVCQPRGPQSFISSKSRIVVALASVAFCLLVSECRPRLRRLLSRGAIICAPGRHIMPAAVESTQDRLNGTTRPARANPACRLARRLSC
jgi:hypothetical protein